MALEVYYDGKCPVCTKEINHYRKIDQQKQIRFVDIANPEFKADSTGIDMSELMEVFHVRDDQGKWHRGVDGFVRIWDELGIFRPLKSLATFSLTRPIFDAGYWGFTKVRPYLRNNDCEDGTCKMRSH